jgi:hypothetical protein
MATADVEMDWWDNAAASVPLPADSPLYQVRSEDETRASQIILEPGALVRIRGSHGMGKTSLVHQLLHKAEIADCKTGYLSLKTIEPSACEDLDQFLQAFCRQVSQALHIPEQLEDYWDDFFGVTLCCKSYFEEYLLPQINGPVVLALDDVDRLFACQEVADDFFGLLRAWHEEAKTREIWQQLRLIVAYSTDLYVPQNINKSPFNVGFPLDLAPFSPTQIQSLLGLWQVALSDPEVNSLADFTGGRPHLVQLAFQGLSRNGGDLPALMQTALQPESPFCGSLQQLHQALNAQPELLETLAAAISDQPSDMLSNANLYRLDSLGLLVVTEPKVKFSCTLYAQWFNHR